MKRCRQEMGKAAPRKSAATAPGSECVVAGASVASTTPCATKRRVHFSPSVVSPVSSAVPVSLIPPHPFEDEESEHSHPLTSTATVVPAEEAPQCTEEHEAPSCSSLFWYTHVELQQQRDESLALVQQQWLDSGYAVLLQNCHQTPHIQTQEYLQAYCALDSKDEETSRGLETRLVCIVEGKSASSDHARERATAKKRHRQAILGLQKLLKEHHANDGYDVVWDKLAKCSRESSAAAKLFAMRMGRADARVVEMGEDSSLAQDFLAQHLQRKHQELQQRSRRLSRTTSTGSQQSSSSGSSFQLALISPTASPSNSYSRLASLICLESPSQHSRSSSLGNKPMMMALPIQSVVYGQCVQ